MTRAARFTTEAFSAVSGRRKERESRPNLNLSGPQRRQMDAAADVAAGFSIFTKPLCLSFSWCGRCPLRAPAAGAVGVAVKRGVGMSAQNRRRAGLGGSRRAAPHRRRWPSFSPARCRTPPRAPSASESSASARASDVVQPCKAAVVHLLLPAGFRRARRP